MVNQEKKRSSSEMFPIIEEWQTGKENKKAFCKQKGIAISVFYYWQKRYKESQDSGGFVPIRINTNGQVSRSSVIEITYPNGVIVRLPYQTLPSVVRQYLHL
jgi:hypothetical protein